MASGSEKGVHLRLKHAQCLGQRTIQAVREEAAVSAHIVSAETDECTIVYPERLILRIKAPTAATPPVSWRIGSCGQ
eukprot:1213629-Amphidinium_carterae.1